MDLDVEAAIAAGPTADAIEAYARGVWDSSAPHRATVARWARAASVG